VTTVRKEPLLQDSTPTEPARVQGLDWFALKLKQDRDGDIADEFIELERRGGGRKPRRLEKGMRPAMVRRLYLQDGKLVCE